MIRKRVDLRNAHTIGTDAPRSGTSSRPHGDALLPCVCDIIPDDQEIIHVAHLLNHCDFLFHACHGFLRRRVTVPLPQTAAAQLQEKLLAILHAVHAELWQVQSTVQLKCNMAPCSDLRGIGDCFRNRGKQRLHFRSGFQIKFIVGKFHSIWVMNGFSGLDAEQHLLHLRILFPQIMSIVGCCKRDSGFPGNADQLRQILAFLRQPVILKFQKEVPCAKQRLIAQCCCFCLVITAGREQPWNFSGKAGGQTDQPLVVLA